MVSRTSNQAWSKAELQTADVAYSQRKIQLSGLSAYPDGSPTQIILISEVPLYLQTWRPCGIQRLNTSVDCV